MALALIASFANIQGTRIGARVLEIDIALDYIYIGFNQLENNCGVSGPHGRRQRIYNMPFLSYKDVEWKNIVHVR